MTIRKKKPNVHTTRTPVDTLVIIGNGLDIWQDLNTSYNQFEVYYHKHLDEILRKLRIRKYELCGKGGNTITFSDVELFYGDPFKPGRLPHNFWSTFEASLDKLDDQRINHYFGKTRKGLKAIRKGARNAQRILRKAFCDWISTIYISPADSSYRFGNNCLFINFNYTDTLAKRFQVKHENIFHIHGEAFDKKSIIFGHASHPELPLRQLYQLGERFRGLYYIEEALYHSDKHVEDNYTDLCIFLGLHGAKANEIKHIYVLGHSFGPADIDYFRHLISATQEIDENPDEGTLPAEQEYLDHIDSEAMLNLNMQYAIHHRERALGIKPLSYPDLEKLDTIIYEQLEDPYYQMPLTAQLHLEAAAVRRRFLGEQAIRNQAFYANIDRMFENQKQHEPEEHAKKKPEGVDNSASIFSGKTEVVQWHISYYNEKDKANIENVMTKLGCANYKLYPTIDECLEGFRK